MSESMAVHCWLRQSGYRVDEGFAALVDRHDPARQVKELRQLLASAIVARRYDPREDGDRFLLEVRRDNGDRLCDIRLAGGDQ